MNNRFTESSVEDAALEWLSGLGYAVVHGLDISPDAPTPERAASIFNTYRDPGKRFSLIVSCYPLYREDGVVRGLDERISHSRRLIGAFLKGIGLEVPNSTHDAA